MERQSRVQVDATAVVAADVRIGLGARIGSYCRIESGCSIGEGSRIAERVTVGAGSTIEQNVTIAPGAYLQPKVHVFEGVTIGPNACLIGATLEGEDGAPSIVVRDHASIGANASIVDAVTIGANAVVGAGAVVNRDVPPNATVVGCPARIVGYRSSPRSTPARRVRASSLTEVELPLHIGGGIVDRLPHIEDIRGSLVFGEAPAQLPFVPHRFFTVFGVSSREVRGEHAHRDLHQFLVCVHGECAVALDNGHQRGEVMLDRPDIGLHIPPLVWGTQYRYSTDAVLLALASAPYDPDDYIRDYDAFMRLAGE